MNNDKLQQALYVIVGAIVVVAALAAFVNLGQETPETATTHPDQAAQLQQRAPAESEQPKTWHPVTTLSGENAKRGKVFEITGTQQRITYTVSGDDAAIYVYLVAEGKSLDRDGGMCQVTGASAPGDTVVYSSPGRYYLDVNGGGTWSMTLEELR